MSVESLVLEVLARCYGLRAGEGPVFKQSQRVREEHASQAACQAAEHEAQRAVDEGFDHLHAAVAHDPSQGAYEGSEHGHRYVKRVPISGKYVVFSDHHVTDSGHRQSFFTRGSTHPRRYEQPNVMLYGDVLARYRAEQYTLIENGDVEELVIFDPAQHPGEMERRVGITLEELKRARRPVRLKQLEAILRDHALEPWLEQLEAFDAEGRLLRIAGNHDFDLQRSDFFDLFRQRFPNQKRVYDYVLVADGDQGEGTVRYAVLHGHQFDLVSNPRFGAQFGETLSETSGLWYQGADRTWRWYNDGPRAWVRGVEKVMNWLVEDDPGQSKGVELPRGSHPPRRVVLPERDRQTRQWVESKLLFHNIAWEYFKHSWVSTILLLEVMNPCQRHRRFFKFRHLDEEHIRTRMQEVFTDVPCPVLVLGHSHEARRDSYSIERGDNWSGYFNSGAAGRFENLVWAVEIVGGVAHLVSWSQEELGGSPVRREWTTDPDYSFNLTSSVGSIP